MEGYNPVCRQAKEDLKRIKEMWAKGENCNLEMGLWYVINRTICQDTEMQHYWQHYNEKYNGATYSDEDPPLQHSFMSMAEIYNMTEEQAIEWVSCMENEDGTKGEHWNIETTTTVMKQSKLTEHQITPTCFYLAMNKVYSDGYKTAEQFGLEDKVEYYVARVKEMIDDKDAVDVEDRLAVYYNCIRKK